MKMNQAGQLVVKETDAIQALYQDKSISDIVVEDVKWIERYNTLTDLFDFPENKIKYELSSELSSNEFVEDCISEWNLPQKYKDIDIVEWLNNIELTQQQQDRLNLELQLYKERNMLPVLQFLLYFIDKLKDNNIVWGVGRGSSVSSYVLFLMGVHRIDSVKYNLDIKEFLK